MSESSGVSPELDIASTVSRAVIMPRSPWLASPGWTNCAGVPVEARVEAILCPTWPLLPMPVTITRPWSCARAIASTASAKAKSIVRASAASPAHSVSSTRRAAAMSPDSCASADRSFFTLAMELPALLRPRAAFSDAAS